MESPSHNAPVRCPRLPGTVRPPCQGVGPHATPHFAATPMWPPTLRVTEQFRGITAEGRATLWVAENGKEHRHRIGEAAPGSCLH